LDVRYFREKPSPEADILGERQWQWLEEEFSSGDEHADLYILVSGTQVLTSTVSKESWRQYPAAYERLESILSRSKSPVLLLSGDRHFSEFSRVKTAHGFPLYDITSSGLNSAKSEANKNRFRLKPAVTQNNFAVVTVDLEASLPKFHAEIRSAESGEPLSTIDVDYGSGN
jgi:alkaline phosphatase D